jgi:hypothetical protein
LHSATFGHFSHSFSQSLQIISTILAKWPVCSELIEASACKAPHAASQAFAQAMGGGEMETPMHPPKYEALEKACGHCVGTANDCLWHCFGMHAMKDTSMAGCVPAAYSVVENVWERVMRSIVIRVIAIQIAHAKHTYVVQQWPEDMAKVPCSAFKRNPNGTWTEVAVFDLHGNRFTGNTYPIGSREAGMLDQKCSTR